MSSNSHMTAAEMEREVEAQRLRIEQRIGEIQERLSPGQLLDEALSYTKTGGAKFASALGEDIASNPIPTALLGVSLAWLIAGAGKPRQEHHVHYDYEPEYPYATISSGGLRRVSHKQDAGEWMSEFADDTGRKFRAKADEMGHRAGHFVDDTGRTVSGFIDNAGNRITDFRDEAGARLDDAMGWASHTWRDATQAAKKMADGAMDGLRGAGASAQQMAHDAKHMAADAAASAQHVASRAKHGAMGLAGNASGVANDLQAQTDQLARSLMRMFQDQPLVAGALAFAAGAAVGAVLPHTDEEDAVLGEAADGVTSKAAEVAEEFYEEGKKKVAALYEDSKHKVEEAYDKAAHQVEDAYRQVKDSSIGTGNGNGKPADLH